jgi:hypothetical protein
LELAHQGFVESLLSQQLLLHAFRVRRRRAHALGVPRIADGLAQSRLRYVGVERDAAVTKFGRRGRTRARQVKLIRPRTCWQISAR